MKKNVESGATTEVKWIQSRAQYTEVWSISSLDIVLGLVGGLSGIVWAFLAILLGSYETFKFENSLIGAIYPTSPQEMPATNDDADNEGGATFKEQKSKQAMMRTVAERGKYFYNYSEYLLSLILRFVCCCCSQGPWLKRRIKKLKRHEAASERLANEIDIVKLLSIQRVGHFMAKLVLKKHQRALVTNFSKYQLDDLCKERERGAKTKSEALLTPAIQADGTFSMLNALEQDESLTEDQIKLLKEISDLFST